MQLWQIYIGTVLVLSLITVLLFFIDKRNSQKQAARRIPEIVLLTLTGFGGSIGALVGMYGLHHKTMFSTKFHFTITVWLSAMLQFTVLILCILKEGGLLK